MKRSASGSWACAVFFLPAAMTVASAQERSVLQRFTINEAFGVAHPDQIIEFQLDKAADPANAHVLGPDGAEVPFQVLAGGRTLALRTDLPANATRTWQLVRGKPSGQSPAGVRVSKTEHYYEIANELMGIRIPTAPLGVTLEHLPAPVQSVRYQDGTWSGIGPNYLAAQAEKLKAMKVNFLEQGPLKTVVEVSYDFECPRISYGSQLVREAGAALYKSTIVVESGQPSIDFEEEADLDVSYSIELYEGLHPDQARYRGHHSNSKASGYEKDGRQYRQWHERENMDAFMDLPFDGFYRSDYNTTLSPQGSIRWMAVWDPWINDSGWYWMIYDKAAPENANLLGIFAGRTSRALGAGFSGTGIYCGTRNNARSAGLTVQTHLRAANATIFPHVRYAWGLFLGTKQDLGDPYKVQNIARQMNVHGGINLGKLAHWELDFPDPKRGYGSTYMDGQVLKRMIERVRKDKDYYSYLYNADPTVRPVIDMWADESGQKAREAAAGIAATAKAFLDAMVNGDGIYNFRYHYWQGGLVMNSQRAIIDQVLASGLLTAAEATRVKAAAALYANILWDDDFTPLQPDHGLNLGTPNMPVMQVGYRDTYALLLAEHPTMKSRAAQVEANTTNLLNLSVNEFGAHISCPHYMGAGMEPTLLTFLQLRMLGKDHFKSEARLARFAEFYMNLMTPPEIRFGGMRKFISVGDGPTESTDMCGLMATGFRDAAPELSARLQGAWNQNGKRHSGFFASSLFMIDEAAPAADPHPASATYPGYCSVLRYGWGTPNETAIWFINGGYLRDHRHNEPGEVVIYALGVPLSLDWGSQYEPRVAGAYLHSTVLPEQAIGQPWDTDKPSLDAGAFACDGGTQDDFTSFNTAANARAHFALPGTNSAWIRTVTLLYPDPAHPALLIRDAFEAGAGPGQRVASLNLMAEGAVQTPGGSIEPAVRNWIPNQELPSAGEVFKLPPGLNKLRFKGQQFGKADAPAPAIDWELYTAADEPQQAFIGNWGHGWSNGAEQNEFAQANGRPLREQQHILRIKGAGAFTTLILPYRKTEQHARTVTQQGDNLIIAATEEKTTVGPFFYSYAGPSRRVLATFNNTKAIGEGLSASGGPTEILLESDSATITAHGPAGNRTLTLPGNWRARDPRAPVSRAKDTWTLVYGGGQPLTLALVKN